MIRSSALIVLGVITLFLTACGEDPGFEKFAASPAGGLRFLNMVSDAPALVLEFGNQSIGTVPFGDASGISNVIPDLERTLTVSYVANNQLQTIATGTLSVPQDQLTTVILTGTVSDLNLIIAPEDLTPPEEASTETTLTIANATNQPDAITFEISDAALEAPLINSLSLGPGELSESVTLESTDQLSITATNTAGEVIWESNDFSVSTSIRPMVILFDAFGPKANNVQAIYTSFSSTLTFPNENFLSSTRVINTIPDQTAIDLYQRIATSSSPTVVGIEAQPEAETNTYQVVVEQLAQPAAYRTPTALASATTLVGSGTLTITNGSTTIDIVIASDGSTAESIVSTINAAEGPLFASLINLTDGEVLIEIATRPFQETSDLTITVDDDDGDSTDAVGLSQLATVQLDNVIPSQESRFNVDTISYVRASNLISDVIPNVNLYLLAVSAENTSETLTISQQTLVAEDLLFGELSPYIDNETDSIIFTATPADDETVALYTLATTLENNRYQRLTITGLAADISGILATEERRPIATEARLSILHAAPSAPLVDIYILGSGQNLEDANPSGNDIVPLSTGRFGLVPDTYAISITDSASKTIIAGPVTIEATPNTFINLVALDADGGGTPIQMVEIAND
jgi:hypothetical protein